MRWSLEGREKRKLGKRAGSDIAEKTPPFISAMGCITPSKYTVRIHAELRYSRGHTVYWGENDKVERQERGHHTHTSHHTGPAGP